MARLCVAALIGSILASLSCANSLKLRDVQDHDSVFRHAFNQEKSIDTNSSEFSACQDQHLFKINPNLVQQSHLGGLGPDDNSTPAIVYGDVFPNSGRTIDLEVTNTTLYSSNTAGKDGVLGVYGNINVQPGTTVHLKMRFLDRNTSQLAQIDPFIFAFFDLGNWINGGSEAIVSVSNFLAYKVSDDTTLVTDGHRFKASQWAALKTNERTPMNLSPSDLAHSVAFLMPPLAAFTMKLKVTPGEHSRNILFNGMSRLSCPGNLRAAPCTTYQCPPDHMLKRTASNHFCLNEECKSKLGNTKRCCDYVGPSSM